MGSKTRRQLSTDGLAARKARRVKKRSFSLVNSVSTIVLASVGIAVGTIPTVFSASASSPAGTVGSATQTGQDPPLTSFASVGLATSGGTIQAVIYDGANTTTTGGALSQTLTGFTVPSSPFTADATAIVADGQNSGNTFTFAGSGTALNDSNAFPGDDAHPSGWSFGGLWDTRNYDVTATVNAGDTAVTNTETGGNSDCIVSVAQVFATGPTAAFAQGGYVAAGAGLRNQGSGNITISGIPAGAAVASAYLFWANINPTDPGEAMAINGNNVTGSTDGTDVSPCWGNGNIYTHSANVTPFVTGNGTYTLSGYQTGTTGGGDPWASSTAPMMEGASLVVFYEGSSGTGTTTVVCPAGQPCSGTASVPGSMSVQVSGQSSTTGTILVQIGTGSASCTNDPYFHAPEVTTMTESNYTGNVNKTVVLTIDKAQVAKNPNQGLAHFKVCYSSPNKFKDINGASVNTGILPNCSAVHNVPPCVTSATKDPAGDVIETFIVPPGDPTFH